MENMSVPRTFKCLISELGFVLFVNKYVKRGSKKKRFSVRHVAL
jgi:hypothetical protein